MGARRRVGRGLRRSAFSRPLSIGRADDGRKKNYTRRRNVCGIRRPAIAFDKFPGLVGLCATADQAKTDRLPKIVNPPRSGVDTSQQFIRTAVGFLLQFPDLAET